MRKLSPDAVFQTTDEIFFLFMEYLSDSERDKFFIDDEENKGTMNTERGQHLFNGIEKILEELWNLYFRGLKKLLKLIIHRSWKIPQEWAWGFF